MEGIQLATALGPNDPDDGDTGRQLRGLLIAARTRIEKNRLGYKVPSQSGRGFYTVNVDGDEPLCACPDFEARNQECKHIFAVQATIQRDELGGEIPTLTEKEKKKAMKPSYGQNWDAYDRAQENEQRHFDVLLRELCDLVVQPGYAFGRPRLPVSDMVYAVATKVYTGMSRRRVGTAVARAQERGLIDHVPAHSSITRYLGDPDLTPVLKHLIQQSANPAAFIETEFALDATGFSTSTFNRWFDEKWGKPKRQAQFVKLHAAFGTKTQIITAAEVSDGRANDSPFFPSLLGPTAENFNVRVAAADMGYLSKPNYKFGDDHGIEVYIPFKSNSVRVDRKRKRHRPWERAFDYFSYHREEFLRRYHVRSMAESGFGSVKAKFGASVRSKTQTGQFNEVLAKVLCHNISVLVRVAYELGVESELETWVADALAGRAEERVEGKAAAKAERGDRDVQDGGLRDKADRRERRFKDAQDGDLGKAA